MTETRDPMPRRRGGLSQLGTMHGTRLRLRTLILIRWVAAAGQTVTTLTVDFGLGFPVPTLLCLAVISTLAVSNILLSRRTLARVRVGDRAAAMLFGFDVVQLAMLLYLTGGLQNPFSILIIAPVLVSATILSRSATTALTLLAVGSFSILAVYRMPLPWFPGALDLPLVYVLGIWTALAVASVFISAYVWSVADESRRMSDALSATQTSLARQQRLSALGGLAAVAAHELGSPLATIAVVAKELSRELPPGSPHAEDVELLLSQSDRCRQILAGLAQSPETSGGEPFDQLRLSHLVETAADPYRDDAVEIAIRPDADAIGEEPVIARSPEILSGLGTLIQNGVQFARKRVEIALYWDERVIQIAVRDDGPGFPAAVLSMIGEPFISTRADTTDHMGLGIFIAQTLLERTGAGLCYANRGGAEVVIRWSRAILG